MPKGSSTPVKKSVLIILRTGVLFLSTMAILGGCANIQTVKIPQEYNSAESKIVIVPIETGYKDAYLSKMNIELLLNEISGAPDLNELKLGVLGHLIDWHPETPLCEKIAEELTRRGRTVIQENEVVPLPENIRGSLAGVKWYNPDISIFDHSGIKNSHHPTVIMEASFESVTVFANGNLTVILVRVIDPQNNRVIARIRSVQNLRRGKYNFKDPIQRQQYVLNFRTEFKNELAKALPKILDGIGF
jgi:hypothetical protein